MLNDEFHAAKEAWKGDAYRMDTFVSRELGNLGFIDELGRAHLPGSSARAAGAPTPSAG